MPLTGNNKALPIFALPPSIAYSVVMFFDFLFDHFFDLGMQFSPDHHEILFWNDDLLNWE